jgi:hypothetical protein
MNCTICQYCCANKNIKSYSSWMKNLLLYWDISLCSDNVCMCGVILGIQLFTINIYLLNYVLVHLFIYLFIYLFTFALIIPHHTKWVLTWWRKKLWSELWIVNIRVKPPSTHSICNVSYHGCTGTSSDTVRPGIQVIKTRPKYMRHTKLQGPTVNKHMT